MRTTTISSSKPCSQHRFSTGAANAELVALGRLAPQSLSSTATLPVPNKEALLDTLPPHQTLATNTKAFLQQRRRHVSPESLPRGSLALDSWASTQSPRPLQVLIVRLCLLSIQLSIHTAGCPKAHPLFSSSLFVVAQRRCIREDPGCLYPIGPNAYALLAIVPRR